jgi:hypothetical protein
MRAHVLRIGIFTALWNALSPVFARTGIPKSFMKSARFFFSRLGIALPVTVAQASSEYGVFCADTAQIRVFHGF